MSESVDLSSFKKTITCGGRRYDEFSNFHLCQILADGDVWPSSEHYYQALKFPGGSGEKPRQAILSASSGMESWQVGNSFRDELRKDWEIVKIDMMYKANLLKFQQSEDLQHLLVKSDGPICCDGGLFWKTWNEIVLERVREELRSKSDQATKTLQNLVGIMEAYSSAVACGDQRKIDAVTQWASKRQLPPDTDAMGTITVSGLSAKIATTFFVDCLKPQVNGQPHFMNDDGKHMYLGKKGDKCAWVVDQFCDADEVAGEAFMLTSKESSDLPRGKRLWQLWDDSLHRHVEGELVIS